MARAGRRAAEVEGGGQKRGGRGGKGAEGLMAIRRKGKETRLENDDILPVNLGVKGLRPSRLWTVTLPSVKD